MINRSSSGEILNYFFYCQNLEKIKKNCFFTPNLHFVEMKKQLKIDYIEALDKLPISEWSNVLRQKGAIGSIDVVNWLEFPHLPNTKFYVAYSSNAICIHYEVKGEGLKALFANDQDPVWQDSCVEFFCKRVDQEGYYNFEFNCIGTSLSAVHKTRENRTSRPKEEMETILRFSSLERTTFEEKSGIAEWSLTVAIPFALIGLDGKRLPEKILANFYKCGDGTQNVHYVSWNAIEVEKPDFHRPDYFGEIYF